jgi:hypothetical protein
MPGLMGDAPHGLSQWESMGQCQPRMGEQFSFIAYQGRTWIIPITVQC